MARLSTIKPMGSRRVFAESSRDWARIGTVIVACLLAGCGPVPVEEAMTRYRESVEKALGPEGSLHGRDAEEVPSIRLPRRRLRRIEVGDQRIGPIDFLATLGCPLSELVGARNGSLGKVLEPTRRLAHELSVVSAGQACLATLGDARAKRLAQRLDAKRRDLGAHVWNAVWLDEDFERFLGSGPRAWIGGKSSTDAAWQLARAAAALTRTAPEEIDVDALETALAELRDDPGMGSVWRDLDHVQRELGRVAELVTLAVEPSCEARSRRLQRVLHERYLPFQRRLGALDRQGRALLEPLDALYRSSSAWVEVPEQMRHFAERVLDTESSDGLWLRYRDALRRHAEAWGPLSARCGLLPQADRER